MVIFAHKRVGFRNPETGAIFATREANFGKACESERKTSRKAKKGVDKAKVL